MAKNKKTDTEKIHDDAQGQFVRTRHGADNDGVSSAKPRVITHSDDATINKWPPGKTDPPKEWSVNHDIGDDDA